MRDTPHKNFPAESTIRLEASGDMSNVIPSMREEQLIDSEVAELVAAIVHQTRQHPDIVHGVSVSGAIAFRQLIQGFAQIENKQTLNIIEKAAMIALPPRVLTRQGDRESAIAIVSDIVQEILYGIVSDIQIISSQQIKDIEQLSLEDFIEALQNLGFSEALQNQNLGQSNEKGKIEIVSGKDGYQQILDNLTHRNSQRKDTEEWYQALEKAIKSLMADLENKRATDKISLSDYKFEKKKLEEILNSAWHLQSKMSEKELAETIIEFMDAKDKQWQKELDFQDMYVYYHIKETNDRGELSLPKRSWYSLKVVIDYFEHQDLVNTDKTGTTFSLTARALDVVLKYFILRPDKDGKSRFRKSHPKSAVNERRQETRKYITGDVYRDISVRHTLREIARRKKKLSDIDRRDLRVFIKENQRPKSDIMLCLDSSGSMGFHQKLTLARLAAAALAKTALQKGDRVGIVSFDDLGGLVIAPTDKEDVIFSYLAGIKAGGNTNIGDGLKCAKQPLLRDNHQNQKSIVLITDGEPTAISEKAMHWLEPHQERDLTFDYTILETKRAALNGIETSVIHITDEKEAGKNLVNTIAKLGHGRVQRITRPADLKEIVWQ
jgi:Mg-chelatase subunit ChlD